MPRGNPFEEEITIEFGLRIGDDLALLVDQVEPDARNATAGARIFEACRSFDFAQGYHRKVERLQATCARNDFEAGLGRGEVEIGQRCGIELDRDRAPRTKAIDPSDTVRTRFGRLIVGCEGYPFEKFVAGAVSTVAVAIAEGTQRCAPAAGDARPGDEKIMPQGVAAKPEPDPEADEVAVVDKVVIAIECERELVEFAHAGNAEYRGMFAEQIACRRA